MTESASPSPMRPIHNYNHDVDTTGPQIVADAVQRVVVPPQPPEFGPAAARALLRLLIAVHANAQQSLTLPRRIHDDRRRRVR
jgi:hypothetical protein